MGKGNLSSYLLQRLDVECAGSSMGQSLGSTSAPKDAEDGADCSEKLQPREESADGGARGAAREDDREDDEISDEHFASDGENGGEVDIAGKRAQFLKSMRDRFVNGRESNFNYDAIDGDSDLDDLRELGQDAEDRYFDTE